MSKTAEHGGSAPAEASFDGLSAIVGDLLRLIEHVQSSIAAIEVELARNCCVPVPSIPAM
jgi:hypothetical protein